MASGLIALTLEAKYVIKITYFCSRFSVGGGRMGYKIKLNNDRSRLLITVMLLNKNVI